jgi:hypothetical protein
VEDNPVNRLGPSGRFSEDMIIRSLAAEGKTVREVFGKERYGYAWWGLYWLLKSAQNWDRIYPATMPPSYTIMDRLAGGGRTRWLDNTLSLSLMGSFDVADNDCELEFMSRNDASALWKGPYSLAQFVEALDQSADYQVRLEPFVYWRTATFANHWYRLGDVSEITNYYSDFTDYVLPDFRAFTGTSALGVGLSLTDLFDRYGNEYVTVGLVGGADFGGDYAEGYVEGPRADEATLQKIVDPSFSFPLPATGMASMLLEIGATLTPNNRVIRWHGYGATVGISGNWTMGGIYRGKHPEWAWYWVDEDIRRYGSQ